MALSGKQIIGYLPVQSQTRPQDPTKVKSRSFFYDPIESRIPCGKSRRWGDATPSNRIQCIDKLIARSIENGLSDEATAYLISMIYIESGFNPDAAAISTSACGLGQFINATAKAYGLVKATRFDADENVRAILQLWTELEAIAIKQTSYLKDSDDLFITIYKYYHDGFARNYGGADIARTRILPLYNKLKKVFLCSTGNPT